ncbi:MAG: hypothetical protein GPOALKHO_000816 [Sodalis sp.]|nr:MAG: hypothetical protein GPOALKHO_000816 [Sodalis sp.]
MRRRNGHWQEWRLVIGHSAAGKIPVGTGVVVGIVGPESFTGSLIQHQHLLVRRTEIKPVGHFNLGSLKIEFVPLFLQLHDIVGVNRKDGEAEASCATVCELGQGE